MPGYKGIVHAAEAPNLGQMLIGIFKADGIPLVNIVRSERRVAMLKERVATQVLDSRADGFQDVLVDPIAATGAMLGFDPIGGGKLSSHMLAAMEQAAVRRMKTYSRYGSDEMKQVYI